ncbi:hypothetical protein HV144_13080 [Citrobacter freundii]|nr:hypothetical protein [Citrobacter freundii]
MPDRLPSPPCSRTFTLDGGKAVSAISQLKTSHQTTRSGWDGKELTKKRRHTHSDVE